MTVSLKVTVPVCSLRKPYAREQLESERIPPPSTVYGFLLSLVGEEDRRKYLGTVLSVCMFGKPEVSHILRTVWRIKDKNIPQGVKKNKTPDYQEILTGLSFGVWVQEGELAERISEAFRSKYKAVRRYGGLSFGESRDLVDEVIYNPDWGNSPERKWLVVDPEGRYPLSIWADHVSTTNSRWEQFSLVSDTLLPQSKNDSRWITIAP